MCLSTRVSLQGLALVAHALASNTLLRSLIIGDTGISDDGVASFTAALRTTATGQASDATLGVSALALRQHPGLCNMPMCADRFQ